MQIRDLNKAYYLQNHFFPLQFSVQSSSHKREKNIYIYIYMYKRVIICLWFYQSSSNHYNQRKKTQKTKKTDPRKSHFQPTQQFHKQITETSNRRSIFNLSKNKEYPIHIIKHDQNVQKSQKRIEEKTTKQRKKKAEYQREQSTYQSLIFEN